MRGNKGFTLVEIMIVVAIIALLAAIAIPNLLRAKVSANSALAQSTLRTLSTAAETFATGNDGNYPEAIASLTNVSPPYIQTEYCGSTISGFYYDCTWFNGGYTLEAQVLNQNVGDTTHTMTTGAILTP